MYRNLNHSDPYEHIWERQFDTVLEQLVTIELFGQPYTFKSESDSGKAERVAETLTRAVTKIEERQSGHKGHMANLTKMILAALDIANENHALALKHSELQKSLSECSNRLNRLLDDGLS